MLLLLLLFCCYFLLLFLSLIAVCPTMSVLLLLGLQGRFPVAGCYGKDRLQHESLLCVITDLHMYKRSTLYMFLCKHTLTNTLMHAHIHTDARAHTPTPLHTHTCKSTHDLSMTCHMRAGNRDMLKSAAAVPRPRSFGGIKAVVWQWQIRAI